MLADGPGGLSDGRVHLIQRVRTDTAELHHVEHFAEVIDADPDKKHSFLNVKFL